MTGATLALYACSTLAAGSAVALAWRTRAHRPVAALLVYGLGADLVARALRPAAGWLHPLVGAGRLGFHAVQVLLAGYPIAVLACAGVVLGSSARNIPTDRLRASDGDRGGISAGCPNAVRNIPKIIPVFAALYLAGLILGYGPISLWDSRLERVYTVAQALVVAGILLVAVPWLLALRRARRTATASEIVALATASVEVINLPGPYLLGFARWPSMGRAAYAVCYILAIFVQGVALWR